MSVTRTLENGEVRKLIRFATGKRKTASRKWKHKWVVIRHAPNPK